MKHFRLNSFNALFFLLWGMITAVLWVFDDSDYPMVIQKILSGISLLGTLCTTTYFLCNYILPKAIDSNKLYSILPHFLTLSVFQAILLWIFQEGLYFLEDRNYLPLSEVAQERETFLTTLASTFPVSILLNLGFGGLKVYFEHGKLHQQHLTLKKTHLEIQLHALQSKITPHFMFNVLNHIHLLIQKDTELASTLLIKYADILRYQLYGADKEHISLAEEIAFINNYIEVETYRWANNLTVSRDVQLTDPQVHIAPHLFIIFIENAFKHVGRPTAEKGVIAIQISQDAATIKLDIQNSKGSIQPKKADHTGIGLKNVSERLSLIYPNRHELIINDTANRYQVTLTITIHEQHDH